MYQHIIVKSYYKMRMRSIWNSIQCKHFFHDNDLFVYIHKIRKAKFNLKSQKDKALDDNDVHNSAQQLDHSMIW